MNGEGAHHGDKKRLSAVLFRWPSFSSNKQAEICPQCEKDYAMHVQTTSFGCISDLLLRYLSCHLILCCRSRTATSRTMNVLTSKLAWMRSSELAGMRSHLEFDKVRRTMLFTKHASINPAHRSTTFQTPRARPCTPPQTFAV